MDQTAKVIHPGKINQMAQAIVVRATLRRMSAPGIGFTCGHKPHGFAFGLRTKYAQAEVHL
jgi:hypothetical protein